MPRLTRIYTGKGDDGTTGLSGGQRVSKDSPRVQAYGTVDELNAVIGLALTVGPTEEVTGMLNEIQNELFHLGSDLSFREEDKRERAMPQIESRHVEKLEAQIEQMVEKVGPLENFILPGGCQAAATLQVARAVCRRAEREVISLAAEEEIGSFVLSYLNRLSDALFLFARYENVARDVPEPIWDSRA